MNNSEAIISNALAQLEETEKFIESFKGDTKAFAQLEKAEALAESLNKSRYNWDGLAKYIVDWEPQLIAQHFLFIYFEFTQYYLSDKSACGLYDELCGAMSDLRSLYKVISQMDKEQGVLNFTGYTRKAIE